MKLRRLLLVPMMLLGMAQAQNVYLPDTLSPTAYIAVMTCGPGDELGENFGHCAMRVCDTAQHFDIVYNYGTYDFDAPNFVWNFCKGKLRYCLSVSPFWHFAATYQLEHRSICEQRLDLTPSERHRIYHALDSNARPENKYYMYDFFLDNCSTRPRDIIAANLEGRTLFQNRLTDTNRTYRQLLYPYTEDLQWFRLGVDLVLGARCDRPVSTNDYMFAPNQLMYQLDTTCLSDTHRPLVSVSGMLCHDTRPAPPYSPSPLLIMWVLFVVVLALTVIGWARQRNFRWIDIILFALTSVISLLVIFMWFFSEHYCTKANLNLLWASPLFICFLARLRHTAKPVVLVQLILLAAVLVMAAFPCLSPQQFNSAIIPLVLALFVRLLAMLRKPAK